MTNTEPVYPEYDGAPVCECGHANKPDENGACPAIEYSENGIRRYPCYCKNHEVIK